MPLEPGTKLGNYEILSPIGAGGQGEVYRARDLKLKRDVAIKVLPDAFSRNNERLARLEREAQLLASLNHPNIASIYGVEDAEGVKALVLELVEGPTLADRIAGAPIPLDEVIAIARQMADGLEAAHEVGIIHRDLKPPNVKVREDGTVKVLDFGLAKPLQNQGAAGESELSQSPTLTRQGTAAGVILGTAAYMSPEQAKGKKLDRRTDVWAFGAVVYEMLTGKRAFAGEDVSDTLAAVLRAEPDWNALPAETPEALRRVLRLCLTKDTKLRVRDIGDVGLAMDGAFGATGATLETNPTRRRTRSGLAALAATALVTGLAVWSVMREAPPTARSIMRFVIHTPPEAPLRIDSSHRNVAMSPDGMRIVYQSGNEGFSGGLYLRSVDQLDATLLRGTEGALGPSFSPDGESVAFRASDGSLSKVSIRGGQPVRIAEGPVPKSISWGPDGTIVFATWTGQGLMQVPAIGGEPEAVTKLDRGETDHLWPEVLPNGKAVLFTEWRGSEESSRIAVVSLETGEVRYLVAEGSDPHYSPTGHIVYGLGGTLRAVRFDASRLTVTGEPVAVVQNVNTKFSGAANFTLARDGTLVYVAGERGGISRTLVWVDRQGREDPIGAEPRGYSVPDVSSDGERIATLIRTGTETDIWVYDLARDTSTRITFDPATEYFPRWSPDGRRIVFSSNREGSNINLAWKPSDGTGSVERLTTSPNRQYPSSWASEGQRLFFTECAGECDLLTLSLSGEPTTSPLLRTRFSEGHPAGSPDGRFIAYQSDASGRDEIYVRPFPDVDAERWQVSTSGGLHPMWGPEGKELFYWSHAGLIAVPLDTENGFTAGSPEVLFALDGYAYDVSRNYAVAPDGKRFLMIKEGTALNGVSASQITVILNWGEELKRLVPPN